MQTEFRLKIRDGGYIVVCEEEYNNLLQTSEIENYSEVYENKLGFDENQMPIEADTE